MGRLSDIEIFVAVVDGGSFTAAAANLGLSKSYVSRRQRMLEDQLGARLLARTTRRLSLTDAGRAYYDQVAPLLEGLTEAERSVAALQAEPRGTLRLAAPQSFGLRWLQPALHSFMERWPDLKVDVSFDERVIDVVADGFDLAIRGGRMDDSTLVARRLAPMTGLVVASPFYLATHGQPVHPSELSGHACLDYAVRRTMPHWWLAQGTSEISVDFDARLTCDSGAALVAAAEAGLGVCYQPDFELFDALQAGRLVRLFPDWRTWQAALYAVYPHRRHLSPKVRLLLAHLTQVFAGPPWGTTSAYAPSRASSQVRRAPSSASQIS